MQKHPLVEQNWQETVIETEKTVSEQSTPGQLAEVEGQREGERARKGKQVA